MRKFMTASVITGLALSSVILNAPAAFAEDVECRGTLGDVTVTGNLIVPDDATCTLDGTNVDGNITVKSRASLTSNAASVTGGIQGESARQVVLNPGTTVGNNVSLRKGGDVTIDEASIKGDLQLEDNTGAVSLTENQIQGSIQANKNRDGGVTISSNNIGNNLQCQDNSPPPTGGNNIAKQKEGQCQNL